MLSENYLDELNPAQRQAVLYCDGPSLVIAGAGAGKTRVLTYKIAHLLRMGMKPWNILALTFTNKAADEMKARIAQQVGEESARRLWMGTFHSIFARILRAESQHLSFSSNYTIYDAADSKSLIKSIIREMKLDDKVYKPSTVLAHISAAKNHLLLPVAYQQDPQLQKMDQSSHIPATGDIYLRYWNRCRQADALDFDDILLYTYLLFFNQPNVLARYEERFQFVLVDEYQDTNYAQHAIVWQLTQHNRRLCVVGDDAQSIYSFRGANIDNILSFGQLYKEARLFKLEQNYRSTQTIVNAANSLIRHNRGQIPKDVFSEKSVGQPIHLYQFSSDLEEAAGVAKKVLGLNHYDHIHWNEMAVLYRTNAQSRTFEEAFRKQDIPYRIFGGLSFYQRKEIKDMIAYFRLAVNPNDEEALKRVINYPARGIGQTSMQKLLTKAADRNVGVWDVLTRPAYYCVDINRGTQTKVEAFVRLINSFRKDAITSDAATLGTRIAKESGVVDDIFRGHDPEDISRQENLQELLDGMQQFVDERQEEEGDSARVLMSNYLQEISLISDLEESDDDDTEKLSLMTVHSAKGLEFRVVFIVGMEENLFPSQMATTLREIEEERRLFYVAITRAEDQCFISFARNRYRYGKQEFCNPSSFLYDIDEKYVKRESSVSTPSHRSDSSGYRSKNGTSPFFEFIHSRHNSQQSSTNTESPSHSSINTGSPSHSAHNTEYPSHSSNNTGYPSHFARHAISTTQSPVSETQTPAGTLHVGSVIEHSRFGRGEVIALSGTGIDAKASVRFENVGNKQLLLRFAKFTIL